MMTLRLGVAIAAFALVVAHQSLAQDLAIYPAQGQSQQQMDQDKFECYGWARDQTGFDPMQAPPTAAPAPQQQSVAGGVAKGALVGGLAGLAIGAIADDAGKGTAIGAIGGDIGKAAVVLVVVALLTLPIITLGLGLGRPEPSKKVAEEIDRVNAYNDLARLSDSPCGVAGAQ
jgi:hypothetical protein